MGMNNSIFVFVFLNFISCCLGYGTSADPNSGKIDLSLESDAATLEISQFVISTILVFVILVLN